MITKEQVDAAQERWYVLANKARDAYIEFIRLRQTFSTQERGDDAARAEREE